MNKDPVSFINGLIAGAGALLAIMTYTLMQVADNTDSMRIAIMIGVVASAISIGYEVQRSRVSQQPDADTKAL